ncbi:MAG: GNAT family N-acetyltransferase, partial [Verrucomicrobiota bacterium]
STTVGQATRGSFRPETGGGPGRTYAYGAAPRPLAPGLAEAATICKRVVWRSKLIALTELPEARAKKLDVTFFPALTEAEVAAWESKHEVSLPKELREFYLESDGMEAGIGQLKPVFPLGDCDVLPQGCELPAPWLEFGRTAQNRFFISLGDSAIVHQVEEFGSEPEFFARSLAEYFKHLFSGRCEWWLDDRRVLNSNASAKPVCARIKVERFDLMPDSSVQIRAASVEDVEVVFDLLMQLARYEKIEDTVQATPQLLKETMFGPKSRVEVLLAEWEGEPAGVAVYFHNYSTFVGRNGMYLEDIFVPKTHRKRGIGKALLQAVARIAAERDCGRMDWAVLEWNKPAIGFYESIGAEMLTDWRIMRMDEEAIQRFADHSW